MAFASQVSPGTVLGGDFRVIELLRSGGMGAVYVAEQLSTGKRRALKLMRPETVDEPRMRERFEQEAKVGALIASDHVVEVIGAGIDKDTDIPWIAMELLEGEDLASAVREHGAFGLAKVREILSELCHAVGAAHDAGVVHRDLKPENVFLAKAHTAAAEHTIKVLDFGIAKLLASARTLSTSAVGTPAWMAPEQTDARVAISPATDIWALGLLAFWLLTARSYWLSGTTAGSSVPAMLREILFEPLEPASVRARDRGVRGRLPQGFDPWFAQCVVRDPRQRFPPAKALLDAFLALEPAAETEAESAALPEDPPNESELLAPLSTRAFLASLGADRAPPQRTAAEPGEPTDPTAPTAATEPIAAKAASKRSRRGRVSSGNRSAVTQERHDAGTLGAARIESAATQRPAGGARTGLAIGAAILAAGAVLALARIAAPPAAPGAIAPSAATALDSETSAGSSFADGPQASPDAALAGQSSAPSAAPAAAADPTVGAGAAAGTVDATSAAMAPAKPRPAPHAGAAALGSNGSQHPVSRPPFQADNATRALEFVAQGAANACSRSDGPRALAVVVTFAPEGHVQAVQVSPAGSPASMCMANMVNSTRVPAFSGGPQTVGVGVTLP